MDHIILQDVRKQLGFPKDEMAKMLLEPLVVYLGMEDGTIEITRHHKKILDLAADLHTEKMCRSMYQNMLERAHTIIGGSNHDRSTHQ